MDYIDRMKVEYEELLKKYSDLTRFMRSITFLGLEQEDKENLQEQEYFMQGYLRVLRKRIRKAENDVKGS